MVDVILVQFARFHSPSPVVSDRTRRVHSRPVVQFQDILSLEDDNTRDRRIGGLQDLVYDLMLMGDTHVVRDIL